MPLTQSKLIVVRKENDPKIKERLLLLIIRVQEDEHIPFRVVKEIHKISCIIRINDYMISDSSITCPFFAFIREVIQKTNTFEIFHWLDGARVL